MVDVDVDVATEAPYFFSFFVPLMLKFFFLLFPLCPPLVYGVLVFVWVGEEDASQRVPAGPCHKSGWLWRQRRWEGRLGLLWWCMNNSAFSTGIHLHYYFYLIFFIFTCFFYFFYKQPKLTRNTQCKQKQPLHTPNTRATHQNNFKSS